MSILFFTRFQKVNNIECLHQQKSSSDYELFIFLFEIHFNALLLKVAI